MALIAGAVFLGACVPPAPPPPAAQAPSATRAASPVAPSKTDTSTVRVGVNFPRTGPIAALGGLGERALLLAVEEINSAGGIKSLGGRKIEPVFADNEGKPDLAISEQERLIQQEKVVATIGSMTSPTTLTATQVSERHGVPHVVPISTADDITQRGFKWTFRISAKSSEYAQGMLDFLLYLRDEERIPIQRVAVMHEDGDLGESIGAPFEKLASGAGLQMLDRIKYPAAASTDVGALLARVQSLNPDLVIHVGYPIDSALVWNTRRQMNLTRIPFIGVTSGVGTPDFMKAVGNDGAEGTIALSASSSDLRIPRLEGLMKAHQAKYGAPAENNGVHAYQAMWVLKHALETAGSVSPADIRGALVQLRLVEDVVLPQDAVQFDPEGQNHPAMVVLQLRGGRSTSIWPPKFASGKGEFGQFSSLKAR